MADANPLPPGSNGLPLVGETLAFVSSPFDFATVMMQLFAMLALRSATWTLPAQNLAMQWVVPPEYKSGLVVAWSRIAP